MILCCLLTDKVVDACMNQSLVFLLFGIKIARRPMCMLANQLARDPRR